MEAELKFIREKRHGVAVVGSSLFDAAARIGVFLEAECGRTGDCDSCAVKITKGMNCLSPETQAEREHLSDARRKTGERLACQATITRSGEISVMTEEKKKEEKSAEDKRAEEFKKDFAALPLEKKIERLLELEGIAFGETVSYVLNAPYTLGGKLVDFLAQYGFKLEADEKAAKKPDAETKGAAAKAEAEPEPKKPKPRTRTKKAES